MLTYQPKVEKQKVRKIDYYFIYLLGFGGMILVFFKIKNIGWIAYLISIISGILIILLSRLIMKEEDEENI